MTETSESNSEYNSSDEEVSITISLSAYHLNHAHSNLTSFNLTCSVTRRLREGITESRAQCGDRDEWQAIQELRRE